MPNPPETIDFTPLQRLGVTVIENAVLSGYTTFQLGGPCPALFECRTPQHLEETVRFLADNNLPFILIGGGSNLLISDEGVPCRVIRYYSTAPVIERQGSDLIVAASTLLDSLAAYAAENGLEGLNYTTGIPGTVGGAVVGNAGAFGKQIGDVVASVRLLDRQGNAQDTDAKDLGFSYRHSDLKTRDEIIVSVRLTLKPGDKQELLSEREEILALRREKHPNPKTEPCAGSIFRNVEPTSQAGRRQAAAWFLEQAGGKNLAVGGAKIFEKHANIIIKTPSCRAQDVCDLTMAMAKLAKKAFNIDLVREVQFVGKFKGKPKDISGLMW